MARRFHRTYARIPVELVSLEGNKKVVVPGSVMDLSQDGLRIQTAPRLMPGQLLDVFVAGRTRPFACCRVVWAQTHGSALPSEAGLEIIERPPWRFASKLRLPPDVLVFS